MKTISLVQVALAIFLVLGSSFSGDSFTLYAGLFLAVTLVPLFPFHLPFASLVSFSHGAMSGLWTTVFLALGLAELTQLPTVLSEGMPAAISWLALGSALYISFKCLGQIQVRPLLAYATIAQVSMLWGLTTVFSTFSPWLIPFGLTIALVMTGLLLTYHWRSTEVWFSYHRNSAGFGLGNASTWGVIDYSDQHCGRTSPYSGIVRLVCSAHSGQSECLSCHHVLHHLLRVDFWELVFFTSHASDGFWQGQTGYSLHGFDRRGNQRSDLTHCCSQL